MSIKALAVELYRAQQKVHSLQDELDKAPLKDKERLRLDLRTAKAECNQLRRIMEGEKETSRSRLSFFKTRT